MSEEKCEYCEKEKIIKSYNFCGSAKMRIIEGKEFNTLEVQGDKEKFYLFKRIYRPRFDINYCPMCGRKLGDKEQIYMNIKECLDMLHVACTNYDKDITGKLGIEREYEGSYEQAFDIVLKELERLSEIQENKMEFCQTQCTIAKERKYYIEQLYELEEKINEILNKE